MYDAGLSREAIFGRTCTTLVLKGLISIHGRVSEFETFVYVTVVKEFTDGLSSVNLHLPWEKTIPWCIYKFMETTN